MYVKHKDNEFVNGRVYTNTIENSLVLLKRCLLEIYYNISRKHLQMYIDEFVFWYKPCNLKELEKFNILLSKNTNRLRYKDLVSSLV